MTVIGSLGNHFDWYSLLLSTFGLPSKYKGCYDWIDRWIACRWAESMITTAVLLIRKINNFTLDYYIS